MSAGLARLEPPLADAAAFQAATGADARQMQDLAQLRALLAEWSGRMNLIGPSGLADFWPRHAWDSAQLLQRASNAKTWADIGAGAGFPGLVLAVLLKGVAGARVILIESLAKRCGFLEAACAALDLPAEVRHARAEDVAVPAEFVTARAVAPLVRLLGFARPTLQRGAVGLFLKGRNAEAEIAEARQAWRFELEILPSLSDPEGRVLRIWNLARAR